MRLQHLDRFLRHFGELGWQNEIFVVEQAAGSKFNRGALLNAGVNLFAEQQDTVILHDVDLLPHKTLKRLYEEPCKPLEAVHCGRLWTTKYTFPNFLGGVLKIKVSDFYAANGFPNECWGWGGEDDVLRNRLLKAGITIANPYTDAKDGLYTELPHEHQGNSTSTKNMTRWEDVEYFSINTDDGVNTVEHKYEALHFDEMTIGGVQCKRICIDLQQQVYDGGINDDA